MDDYNKGVEYQQQQQNDLAEQQFKLALQENPDMAEAHLNMGKIYLDLDRGWLEGAENSTKKAIEIFERTKVTYEKGSDYKQPLSAAYNNLGVIEIQRDLQAETVFNMPVAKQHYLKAMGYFKNAVDLDPMDSQAQANLSKFKGVSF